MVCRAASRGHGGGAGVALTYALGAAQHAFHTALAPHTGLHGIEWRARCLGTGHPAAMDQDLAPAVHRAGRGGQAHAKHRKCNCKRVAGRGASSGCLGARARQARHRCAQGSKLGARYDAAAAPGPAARQAGAPRQGEGLGSHPSSSTNTVTTRNPAVSEPIISRGKSLGGGRGPMSSVRSVSNLPDTVTRRAGTSPLFS